MRRTTAPPGERQQKAAEIVALSDEEFEDLLENRGGELVRIEDADELEELLELKPLDAPDEKESQNLPETPQMFALAPMKKALSSVGVTKEFMAGLIKEALEAKRTVVFLDQKNGKIIYSDKLIDWKTRADARKEVHQLLQHYPPETTTRGFPRDGATVSLKAGPAVRRVIREIEETVFGGQDYNAEMDGDE
jgi:hypothetical protein